MGLRDGQKAAVSVGSDGEHEGLSSEYRQLSHHLPGMCEEQASILQAVNLLLVHMQHPRDHKQNVDVLRKAEKATFSTIYVTVAQNAPWTQNPGKFPEPH